MRDFQSTKFFLRKKCSSACSLQSFKRLPIYMAIALYVNQKNEDVNDRVAAGSGD
jgi:hypothetical protein